MSIGEDSLNSFGKQVDRESSDEELAESKFV